MADVDARYGNEKISTERVDFVREEYKRYKRKKPPPDLSEVIDFQDPATFGGRVEKLDLKDRGLHSKFGVKRSTEWQAYKLSSCPGFMFIVNPFLPGAQHYWTLRCMLDFPRKPNVCNLDAHVTLDPSKSVWEESTGEKSNLMERLRWVHLGYHFDYNIVDYKSEKYYEFPSDLAGLTRHIANAIGYPDYSPEAGIVNYYPLGGSMGGHTDHYESDLSWPLISLSFGQSAIFLIGGATRDIRPSALYIRSGDLVIMSGESRTAFHAVPRIMKVGEENEAPPSLKWQKSLDAQIRLYGLDASDMNEDVRNVCKEKKDDIIHGSLNSAKSDFECKQGREIEDLPGKPTETCDCNKLEFFGNSLRNNYLHQEEWRKFEIYLSKTRININVRQVHEKGKTVKSNCP